jgi:DNA polymerase-4
VTPDTGAAWVETLPVSRLDSVGPVTAEKMKRLAIEAGADLRAKSLAFLQEHFGSSGGWYYAIARGEDHRPVNPDRVRKSSGSETTFDRDLTDAARWRRDRNRHRG